jgi:excisionase family DNA binding protein
MAKQNMTKTTTVATLIDEEERAHIVRGDSADEKGEPFLTTPEAAAYLRVSKSYFDKLRVYGGGPEFIRLGKRKILYRKSDLDLWADQRRFGSTSEYRDDDNSSGDKSELSNAEQQHPIINR